jgi:hypothetical protein
MDTILSSEQGEKSIFVRASRRPLPAVSGKQGTQRTIATYLTPTGLLPEELENPILMIILRASLRSIWRLILQDVIWLHAPGARPVLLQSAGPPNRAPVALCGPTEPQVGGCQLPQVLRMAQDGQVNQELAIRACDPGMVGYIQAITPQLVEVQGAHPIVD